MKFLSLIALSVVLCFNIQAQKTDSTTLTKIGDRLPVFKFENSQKQQESITDYKGKVILINLFATWCGSCNKELPQVQKKIWDQYHQNKDFALFVFGREEGWDKLTPFVQKYGYTFPILPDVDRSIFSLFATQSIPRNILINKEGKIIYQSIGYEEKEFNELLSHIDKALKQ